MEFQRNNKKLGKFSLKSTQNQNIFKENPKNSMEKMQKLNLRMQKLNLRMQKLNFPGTHWRGLAVIDAQKKPLVQLRLLGKQSQAASYIFSVSLVHHTSRKKSSNRFRVAILLYDSLWTCMALNCGFMLNSYNSLLQIIKVKLDVSKFKQLYLL